jgi:hypothetical protein
MPRADLVKETDSPLNHVAFERLNIGFDKIHFLLRELKCIEPDGSDVTTIDKFSF